VAGSCHLVAELVIEPMCIMSVMARTEADFGIAMLKSPSFGTLHQGSARTSQTICLINDDAADLRVGCRDQGMDAIDMDPTDDLVTCESGIEANRPLRLELSEPFCHLICRRAIPELSGKRDHSRQIGGSHGTDIYAGDVGRCG
jgi:hypothetical protein